MEHNGDVFSCDHFVEPTHKLGNINIIPLAALVNSDAQWTFGQNKRDTLPNYCLDCEVCFVCNGGCPKNRFLQTPDGEAGLNFLCEGYRAFFNHIDEPMRFMANELAHRRPPANVMGYMLQKRTRLIEMFKSRGAMILARVAAAESSSIVIGVKYAGKRTQNCNRFRIANHLDNSVKPLVNTYFAIHLWGEIPSRSSLSNGLKTLALRSRLRPITKLPDGYLHRRTLLFPDFDLAQTSKWSTPYLYASSIA